MKYVLVALSALILSSCEPPPAGEPVTRTRIDGQAEASPSPSPSASGASSVTSQVESACRAIIFEDTSLTHCLAVPSRHRIAMTLGPDGGDPYRSLTAFSRARGASGLAFAMNAGMYGEDGRPIGYFVVNSQRLATLNTNDGDGNFHMKPNGVFFGTGDQWEIRTTDDFLANVSDRPEFGTQSGPMLVIDGEIHPEITRDGPSRFVRNGVGMDERGRAHFVISNAPLSFGKLARFFKDELNATDALFLDGNVSALWNPATERLDTGAPIGPIVVVERKDTSDDE
ncbi:hypothetical protein GRI34_04425 [Erythrobacter aquimaris]|uniref:Phosphodiester glycosidase domain-containing protein n=1 Tax=Qipengyuania aquimaris TaxID=255984 RepID=A0A6I4TIP9_9SPHN|nr:phosphodiester glycosidase family protein [Qipengyuania aquimaris]MXO95666.1 hypothetical protein [Qipengyuania aquimaris]